ncbi:hypothetical protein BDR26DRAFT_864903 [Obelidium mucronatum]|nr:hypothetical protein BDR26DRAFT_888067 [Obelidium mucronatum]KAI9336320.1 hypothetical protein BDR26DRAFT_864903 [Obelidium mucronatum]
MSSLALLAASALCATTQHGIYAAVYLNRNVRVFLAKNHSSFVVFAYALKLLTLALGASYVAQTYGFDVAINALTIIGSLVFAYGFYLNYAVHTLLGTTGIYYGFEFGLVPPGKRVTGFPYSVHNDPQYLGCMMQLLATALIFGVDPVTFAVRPELWAAAVYMCGLYFFTIEIEKLPLAQ